MRSLALNVSLAFAASVFACGGDASTDGDAMRLPDGAPAPSGPTMTLSQLVDDAGKASSWFLPRGSDVAIALQDLRGGARASFHGDVPHVSASSAKILWLAAALRKVDASALDADAKEIFSASLSYPGPARFVERAGGGDAVNDFYWNVVGARDSQLMSWPGITKPTRFDGAGVPPSSRYPEGRAKGAAGRRASPDAAPELSIDNFITANDAVTFYAKYNDGSLLDGRAGKKTRQLRAWARGGLDWIRPRIEERDLPPDRAIGKPGWLPYDLYPAYAQANSTGIVGDHDEGESWTGPHYAVAILTRWVGEDGQWGEYIAYAHCVIFYGVRALMKNGAYDLDGLHDKCKFPEDPARP
ncbi:MAG: hypothetical protein KF819_30715 [Labilithrix sp.]|nr:hypothetical protein [Labilithrix sp.]